MENTIKIGILGGCLNSGWLNVPRSAIYHQIVRKRLKQDLQINNKIHLESYGEFKPLSAFFSTEELKAEIQSKILKLSNKNIDCLIFQLRPHIYSNLCSPFGFFEDKLLINPFFNNGNIFSINVGIFAQPFKHLTKRGRRTLGTIFGFSKKSESVSAEIIKDIAVFCNSRKIKLFVLLPCFPLSGSRLNRLDVSSFLNNENLGKVIDNITFIDLQSIINQSIYVEVDNDHINKAGHSKIAEFLFIELKNWLDSSMKLRQSANSITVY